MSKTDNIQRTDVTVGRWAAAITKVLKNTFSGNIQYFKGKEIVISNNAKKEEGAEHSKLKAIKENFWIPTKSSNQ